MTRLFLVSSDTSCPNGYRFSFDRICGSETGFRLPTNVGHAHEVSISRGVDGKIQRSIDLDAMEQV
jgi:hypothetical protein